MNVQSATSTVEQASTAPVLVVIPAVTASRVGDEYMLDEKAVSGLELYARYWPGTVRGIFRDSGASALSFKSGYGKLDLPFEIRLVPADMPVPDRFISDAAVVLASGDMHQDFPLAAQGKRLGVPVCFTIEYIPETRLQIMRLGQPSQLRRFKSTIWHSMTERKRRRAFSQATGIQSNGTPAAKEYKGMSGLMTYFDTRLSADQMATDKELEAKQNYIKSGAPIRLAYSGRLEPMKGADDLIKIADALKKHGLDFTLDIFGSGSLEQSMRDTQNPKVRIHKPVDFNTALVPFMREKVDLFLCCHRQSDPSCTYLETLGCGVPILGYDNRAWRGIRSMADVGWSVPMNNYGAMVQNIIGFDTARRAITIKGRTAREFAKLHSAEAEFKKRVEHLRGISRVSNAA